MRFFAVMNITLTLIVILKDNKIFQLFLIGEELENYIHLTVNSCQNNPNFYQLNKYWRKKVTEIIKTY